jgi:hypothetical protein
MKAINSFLSVLVIKSKVSKKMIQYGMIKTLDTESNLTVATSM